MSLFGRLVTYLLNPRSSTAVFSAAPAGDEEPGAAPGGQVQGGLSLRYILNPPLVLGAAIVAGLVLVVLFGPLWVDHDPFLVTQSMRPHYDVESGEFIRLPLDPSAEYPLGTDEWGNDMLSLIVYGARVTLIAGAYITLARLLLGTLLGSLAGWRPGGWLDRAMMSLIGVVAAVPTLLSSMILIYALGIHKGTLVFVVALAVVGWTEIAQYVRGEMLVLRKMPYVEGARAVGLTDIQVVVRHILPNLLPQLLILSFLEMGAVLILVAELGFLDVFIGGGSYYTADPIFGPTLHIPDIPEWGVLVAQGAPSLRANAHLVLGPALAFFVSVVGMNAFGEGLRRLVRRSPLSTAFLLQRRTLVGAVLFAGASIVILQMTGASRSFGSVIEDFSTERAAGHVQALAEMAGGSQDGIRGEDAPSEDAPSDGPPAAEVDPAAYIEEQFEANGLARGWKPPGQLSQSYFYTGEEADGSQTLGVFGFKAGFDARLSSELVVLLAPFGGQRAGAGWHESSGLAVMIETARLWQARQVDPRRSLLFVAWRGEMAEVEALLADPQSFRYLPAPTRAPVRPVAVIRLDDLGSGEAPLLLHPSSDPRLLSVFSEAAATVDVPVSRSAYRPFSPPSAEPAFLAMQWNEGLRSQAVKVGRLQAAGEMLNLALLRMTRLTVY